MKINNLIILALALATISCNNNTVPKPKAMLRLSYPKAKYTDTVLPCSYTFKKNTLAKLSLDSACNMQLHYPFMKAAIYLTYKPVNNNLETLLRDAQKLTFEHTIKADNITEQPFINNTDKVYGMFYEVGGNAASQSQFYVTDSLHHFVTGSLYFYAKPNYDSILPAADYLKKDIRKIIETISWKE